MAPVNKRCNSLRGTLSNRLDRTVTTVAHPTAQTQSLCFTLGRITVKNALYTSTNAQPYTPLGHAGVANVRLKAWWTGRDLNPGPPACKAGDLPG